MSGHFSAVDFRGWISALWALASVLVISVPFYTGLRYFAALVTPSTYVPPYAGTTVLVSARSIAIAAPLTTTSSPISATTMNLSRALT